MIKNSGEVHAQFKRSTCNLFKMKEIAELVVEGEKAWKIGDAVQFGKLMDKNFELRQSIMPISQNTLELINVAKLFGAFVKQAGSGGCVVGIISDYEKLDRLKFAYEETGASFVYPLKNSGV